MTKNNERTDKKFKTADMVYSALGTALIAVCSWISIPTTIPFTLQTFAVFTVLGILGGKRGTASIIAYLFIGAIGIPVFAEFTSGIGIILGNTGGYMVGFIFMGLIFMLSEKLFGRKLWADTLAMIVGLAVCYAFGTAWFMLVYARQTGAVGVYTALAWCVFPFIIPDLIKMGVALAVSRRVVKAGVTAV